jgi:hypothetical protein
MIQLLQQTWFLSEHLQHQVLMQQEFLCHPQFRQQLLQEYRVHQQAVELMQKLLIDRLRYVRLLQHLHQQPHHNRLPEPLIHT